MDSLGDYHNKSLIARPVRRWLNREWIARGHKPLAAAAFRSNIFDVGSMPLIQPKVPSQTNGCDCGVFMCRYAYSLYVMRHMLFTKADIDDKCRSMIGNSPSYNFGMDNIARLRRELKQVITKLSPIYLRRIKRKRKLQKRKQTEESRQAIKNLHFSVQSESRTGEKARKFEIKEVSQFGKVPKCNLCSREMDRGDTENPAWNIVTGGKHYCFYCVKYFSRQERIRINSLVMIDEEIDEFTQKRLTDIMRDSETSDDDTDTNG